MSGLVQDGDGPLEWNWGTTQIRVLQQTRTHTVATIEKRQVFWLW